MRKTIAETRREEMEKKGCTYLGMTTGQYSFRKGSNLARKLEQLGKDESDVEVVTGAHMQRGTEGWQLLIFAKPDPQESN